MSTTHETCSNCGANLPNAEVGEVRVCHFCGIENRIVAAPPPAPAPAREETRRSPDVPVDAPPTKTSRGGMLIAVGIVAIPVVAVVAGYLNSRRGPAAPTKVPLATLHSANVRELASTYVDAPPIRGSLERFDALDNVDWAKSVGVAWWPDAVLKKIDVDPVRPDGMANLTTADAHATYDFSSAACVADFEKRAETTPGLQTSTCTLHVVVGKDGPYVSMSVFDKHKASPVVRPPCSMAQVLAHLAETGKLPTRPTYAMTLEEDWHVAQGYDSAAIPMGIPDVPPAFCKAPRP